MKSMEFYVIKTNKGYITQMIGYSTCGFTTTNNIYAAVKDDDKGQMERLCNDIEKELNPKVVKIKCMEYAEE